MPSAITFNIPAINDLTDVVITAAAAGDVLRHDGANWVDYALDQAAVAGLTTASGPTFDYVDLGTKSIKTTTRARAYLNAAQLNITSNVWNTILLDTENYDSGSNFSTVTHRFTAPVAGHYLIIGNAQFSDVQVNKAYLVGIYTSNHGIISYAGQTPSGTTYVTGHIADIWDLDASEYVELQVFTDATGSTVDVAAGGYLTFLSVHLLSTA